MANRKGSGRGGRKPAPVALKIAGGVRPDRINVHEPKAPSGRPVAPPDLDGLELEGWTEFVEDVERIGLLSPVDRHSARDYAVMYARGRRLADDVKARGILVPAAHGIGQVVNPSVVALAATERNKMALRGQYGLNPSDRGRLRATEQTVDEFEEFLKSGS